MLSLRKKIAASMTLLVAAAGVAAVAETTSSAAAPPAPLAASAAKVGITILPGVIGPGSGVAGSAKAKWAVIGKFSASKKGKTAKLQRQSGTSWKTADKVKIGKDGNAIFPVSYPGSTPVTYRVTGPGGTSSAVSTDAWGTTVDFVDEFSGSKLGSAWQHRMGDYMPQSMRKCSKGSSKAVKVGKGTAQLSVLIDKSKGSKRCAAKKANGKALGKYKYRLNANMSTQGVHDITYGVLAARIKFQPLQGQHASLWMQPVHASGAKNAKEAGTEIDVIEWFGKDVPNGGLTSFVYAPFPGGSKQLGGWIKNPDQYLTNKNDSWYKRYHVFSVEWSPSAYVFRIDGQETHRITKGVSGVPEYPILSLLSSDYELPKLPKDSDLPQTMNVDWIRMWQDPAHLPPTPTPAP